jgi:hypothetical protein
LANRDEHIAKLAEIVANRDEQITRLNLTVVQLNTVRAKCADLEAMPQQIQSSVSYKIILRMRSIVWLMAIYRFLKSSIRFFTHVSQK